MECNHLIPVIVFMSDGRGIPSKLRESVLRELAWHLAHRTALSVALPDGVSTGSARIVDVHVILYSRSP